MSCTLVNHEKISCSVKKAKSFVFFFRTNLTQILDHVATRLLAKRVLAYRRKISLMEILRTYVLLVRTFGSI